MNKYTAEQARSSLQKMLGHPLTVAERAELFSMASNYADLLRERESANNNDTCTDADCHRCNTPAQHRGDMSHAGELRAKFEAHFSQPPYEWSFARYTERQAWPGSYARYNVQCAWESYQAAYASRDAEVETLKRDAERYRWLRAATNRDWTVGKDSEKGGVYQYYGQDVDATIDAAMAKESGE